MKIRIQHILHKPSSSFQDLIRSELESLQSRLQIDEARVVVERREQASPAFRVAAHLVTPGPDIAAEGVDHTLRAALRKLVSGLEERLRHRRRKQASRKISVVTRPPAWTGL